MSKKNFEFSRKRRFFKNYYLIKNYEIWMNRFQIKELDYQQNEYLFRKLWSEKGVAGFILDGSKGSTEAPNGLPVLCLYAPSMYNIYDYPTHCTLINTRGVKFIPSTLQEIDKDVVIFYSNKLRKPIYSLIEPLIDRLALIECVIHTNLNSHKVPFLIPISPEDEMELKNLWHQIEADEDEIFVPSESFDKIKILLTGNQYILDKLYALRDKVEGEIREFFGFNNLPVNEKKEHLISDEVESNNEYTAYRYDILKTMLEDDCKRFTDVFGYKLTLVENKIEPKETKEEEEIQDEI